ncbi:FAD-binding oxidoreductase [Salinisphaera sp. LB1]|uniref:NAD(P)/FAD-dependent oxidoreductase n=1 Tax=Salinisphaera sp. LB1 TaxID=2183911 RepID=UPI000D70748B|nr:FAD-binding oxidoreductase [Salinisphaera sp. LB1]AWN15644.1 O-acetylhomoserine sulfhydrylase [Salinisphaera sp. LB1]
MASQAAAYPGSYYAASIAEPGDYPGLDADLRVDVAVVGGGFTGVATALELAERGHSVALIEANRIGWGASGRNGGQVTGSLSGEAGLKKHLRDVPGGDVEAFVWDLRWRGQRIIEQRVQRYGIDCDLKHGHLQAAWKQGHVAALKADLKAAQARGMGDRVRWIEKDELRELLDTPLYHGALRNDANLHLHPLNLVRGEARAAADQGVAIFEGSPVVDIQHGAPARVVTAQGSITADTVVLAGGAYHKLARRDLAGKLFPAALGIVTTAPLGETAHRINPEDLAVYDTRFVLDYYRLTADGRLLFGGGANYSGRESEDVAAYLRPRLEATFPALAGVAIDYQWQGMAGIVPNRMPMLGRTGAGDNVYYAQGYSGHGVATSHIVASVLAEAIDGQAAEFDAFAGLPHGRVPFGERFGNTLLALGMTWYRLLETIR